MRHQYFKQAMETMESNFVFKLKTFDRQSVIDDIDYLIRQLKITKEGISGAPTTNYESKRHAAEWLFIDSQKLDNIIKTLTKGGYDIDYNRRTHYKNHRRLRPSMGNQSTL